MWYKVDWDRFILLLLPTFLRKVVLFNYLRALISPIGGSSTSIYYRWEQQRTANLKKLSYNSQKCYLRKALNDYHDTELRRIYTTKVPQLESNYLFQPEENLDFYLETMWLDLDYTQQSVQVDFLVFVPQDIYDNNKSAVLATLEYYVLASKTYKLMII